jgi:GNAT superfamily N-acetyltransferase
MMRESKSFARKRTVSFSRCHSVSDHPNALLRFSLTLAIIYLLGTSMMFSFSVHAVAPDPDYNTFFEYEYFQKVDSGSGAYDEYYEETKAKGRYEVISWGPDEVNMSAEYSWTYWNNEGMRDSGRIDRIFSFSLHSRNYTSSEIDLDDPIYTSQPPNTLAQWIWIPPGLGVAGSIRILDEEWTVTDKDKTLWSKFIPRKAIEVVATGFRSRDDEYGDFTYSYTDRLYYDKDSGMFFAERYEEWDVGYWEGQWAKFRYIIEIDVTRSSYDVEIDWTTLIFTYASVILLTLGTIGGIGYLVYRARWARRTFSMKDLTEYGSIKGHAHEEKVVTRRVWKMKDFPHLKNNATDFFEPFLKHWTEKALLAKDRVGVAVSKDYGLVGFALYNKEAKIGTVLCKNTEITETLRSFIGCKDFFSERKHIIKPSAEMRKDKTLMRQLKKVKNEAYNVFETHRVYELSEVEPITFDTKLVRPMRAQDMPNVITLAKKVFRRRARRWITACFDAGDIAYVASIDERIVGFGFACVSGSYGRLHTLGVAKEHRGRGIGKELHLARLRAMQLMGVINIIDEIADWNLASIRISTLSGFKPIGKMYVETTRTRRIKKNIVRR